MWRTASRIAVAVAVGTATFALLSRVASASPQAGTYSVVPGGAVTTSLSTPTVVFTDSTAASNPKWSCTALAAPGVAYGTVHHAFYGPPDTFPPVSGAVVPGSAGIPAITAASTPNHDVLATFAIPPGGFTGCTNVFVGATTFVTMGTTALWLNDTTPAIPPVSITSAHGYLGGIQVHVSSASCSFNLTGWTGGTYAPSTGVFTFDSSVSGLKISSVFGPICAVASVADGHLVNMSGAMKVNPPQAVVLP